MPEWKRYYEGVEEMKLAVMGCIVNGPGESKAANIGISLPGTGESPRCPVYIDGQKFTTLEGNYDELSRAFQALVDDYISNKYPRRETPLPATEVPARAGASQPTPHRSASSPEPSSRHFRVIRSGFSGHDFSRVTKSGAKRLPLAAQFPRAFVLFFLCLLCFLYLACLRK